jgi:SAM-dependent methyltransferase
VALLLAGFVGAAGKVTGADIDGAKLEIAVREAQALGLRNVEFEQLAVEDLAGAQHDLVYARFLLTHLPDPLAAARSLWGVTRPGGLVVVEDVDFAGHFCHPECPAFSRYVELYQQVVRRRGGDPTIGPRLPTLLRAAGCQGIQVQVVQPAGMEGEVKLVAGLTLENIAGAILAEGLAARPQIDALLSELHAFAADSSTLMSLPRVFQVWGRRPA